MPWLLGLGISGTVLSLTTGIFVADIANRRIRRIDAGIVTTFAGPTGSTVPPAGLVNGSGAAVRFSSPEDVVFAPDGNLYVADGSNGVRKITPDGVVSTFASGSPFNSLQRIGVDSAGNLYAASSNCVFKITPAGSISVLAGDTGSFGVVVNGTGAAAKFAFITGLDVDAFNNVYVSERDHFVVRKITPAGVVTTWAGAVGVNATVEGPRLTARFKRLNNLMIDEAGDMWLVGQFSGFRKISGGIVSSVTVDGAFGPNFDSVCVDLDGVLFMSMSTAIYTAPPFTETIFAGIPSNSGTTDGAKLSAKFGGFMYGLAIDGVVTGVVEPLAPPAVTAALTWRPTHVAFDGTHIWIAGNDGTTGNGDGILAKVDPITQVMEVFNIAFPSKGAIGGIEFVGTNVWIAGKGGIGSGWVAIFNTITETSTLHQHTGSPINSDIAFDGTQVWTTGFNSPFEVAVRWNADGTFTNFQRTFGNGSISGIAAVGSNIWALSFPVGGVTEVSSLNTGTGLWTDHVVTPNTQWFQLRYDGTYLWAASQVGTVLRFNPVTLSYTVATLPSGTAFLGSNGTHRWYSADFTNNLVITKLNASTLIQTTVTYSGGNPALGGALDNNNNLWFVDTGRMLRKLAI